MADPEGRGTSARATVAIDDLFAAMADWRRRALLRYLRDHTEATESELAEAMTALLSDEEAEETVSYEEVREDVRETHLPELAETGLVTYDESDGVARISSETGHLVEWFDLPPEWAHGRPRDTVGDTPPGTPVQVLYVGEDGVAPGLEEQSDAVTVVTETTADDALERLSREYIDCVVSDYELPDSDALALLEAVQDVYPDLPFIVFTDRGSERVASDAFAAGAAGYLRKSPGQYESLANRIVDVVRQDSSMGYRQVFERIGDGALVYDRGTGEILDVNRKLCELLGYERADLLRARVSTLTVGDPGTRPGDVDPTGEPVEWRVETSDGEERFLEASPGVVEFGGTECVAMAVRDVTEYRETEAALRESNRMFSTLVSNLPGMAYRCRNERGWPMEFVSEKCAELTGYDADAIESGSVSWGADIIHPDDRDAVWEDVQAALDRREPFEITYRIVREDGDERWVWEQGRGIYEGGAVGGEVDETEASTTDRVVALEGFITDVSEREERERELREERSLVESILTAIPDVFYLVDEEGTVLRWNDRLSEVTGYTDEEIAEMNALEFVVEEDRDEAADVLATTFEEGDGDPVEFDLLTRDGEQIPYEFSGTTVTDDDGNVVGLTGVGRDVSEREERERRLEAVFDGTYQFTGLMDPDGTLLEANRTGLEFGGVDREEVVGEKFWDTYWWQVDEETREELKEAVDRAANGESVRYEVDIRSVYGIRTIDFSIRPVTDESGEVTLLVPEGRDVTERKRRAEQLEALNEVSQELTEAESVDDICDLAVEAASETLGHELAIVELYDEESGTLEPHARSEAVAGVVGDRSPFDTDADVAWQAYVENEVAVYEDLREHTGSPSTETPLDSAIVLPLGKHGVIVAGATTPDAFTDVDVDLARILTAHAEAALDRVDRERSLRERTEMLERKNEHLERTIRVNEVIRGLTNTVLDASSREEIQRQACTTLAEEGPYRFAWIGSRDPVSEELRPEARAGEGDSYLEAVTVRVEEEAPDQEVSARAFHAEEPRVIETIRTDPPFEEWQKAALDRDFRTAIAVPIVYEDALYGALTLYGDEPGMFDSVEQTVVAELGETIGYAINAVERKEILTSNRVVELEFHIEDPDSDLFRYFQRVGGEVELEGMVPEGEGPPRLFFSVQGESPGEVREFAEDTPGISDVRHVSDEGEEFLLEVAPASEGMVTTVLDHGAVPRELAFRDDQLRIGVELPESRNVREFTEMFEARFEDATLVARREHDRPLQSLPGVREELTESLTDRQREALKTAYFSGFFESPRENTGEEVAAALDVSQPTFNRHLRTGERKLLERLFDE